MCIHCSLKSWQTRIYLLRFHSPAASFIQTPTKLIAADCDNMVHYTCQFPCATTCSQLRGFFPKPRLPPIALPDNEAAYDEVAILASDRSTNPIVQQRIPFTNLPAEIRNYIYDLALPSQGNPLIVATPACDDLMLLGDQPPLTRTSKQLRTETLGLFYANASFVAYIENFDFTNLVRWAKCITSTSSPTTVRVEVNLMSRIKCAC